MTLGQLAQELEKSANSLANTLRQVGLADRLLHESNIITRDQEGGFCRVMALIRRK